MKMKNQAGSGAIYGIGVIGALVYFLMHTHGFQEIVFGVIKAVFWPGVIVYKVLELLRM